ncbi:hypothetical protein LMH87_001165 [Akanthomyces muscarius]|uniref:Protein kinase domain-containing protein n=1 Tax=Akanthomyces muscarius TaxID=2231603 RepID=A0A9W8UPK1_AKAMU|nr:hypothetical protein LMH87_001165 [Akanthomyces muscarius]KAJ4155945.1 hypothetical protein LMH87_001165 [Akanthomyces muscarius]
MDSDNADSFCLFSLKPANRPAGDTVRRLCRGRARKLTFRTDQVSPNFPRAIAALGNVPSSDDVLLRPYGVLGTQCYFVMTPVGDLMLCDIPDTPPTILSACNDADQVVSQYVIRWPGDNCVLPMCADLTFMISFSSGELFKFRWEVGLHWDNVRTTREALSRQYAWRAASLDAQGPSFPISGRGIVEPKTQLTPVIDDEPISKLVVKETHKYRLIGEGWSSFVHHAVDIRDGREYAVKSINMVKVNEEWNKLVAAAVQFKLEVESLAVLHHPNIIKVIHSQGWSNERPVEVFMTLYHGNATSLVRKHRCDKRVSTENSRHFPRFLIDCLGALDHLHRKDLVHRDVKLANILFARTPAGLEFALSDFGVATLDDDAEGHYGDRIYTPPELADRKGKATSASDMYGFGIAILEFLGVVCRDCYYVGERKWRARMRASDYRGRYQDFAFPRESHFCYARIQYLREHSRISSTVKRMLEPEPGVRPSAEEALVELANYYEFNIPAHIWPWSS